MLFHVNKQILKKYTACFSHEIAGSRAGKGNNDGSLKRERKRRERHLEDQNLEEKYVKNK